MDRGRRGRGEVRGTGRGKKREREREDITVFENGESCKSRQRKSHKETKSMDKARSHLGSS